MTTEPSVLVSSVMNLARAAYERGDYLQAAGEFRLCADAGNSEAMGTLGYMYLHGLGVEKNEETAFCEISASSLGGDIDSTKILAVMYYEGVGIEQDLEIARNQFTWAADHESVEASFFLGTMCYLGQGGPVDHVQAFSRWMFASRSGHAKATHMIGVCYLHGNGVVLDRSTALDWFEKADALGCEGSKEYIKVMNAAGVKAPDDA